ncbi:hypothetical protein R80B4_00932 [Fibrobacteres bacterium R8-0-B4]
MNGLSPTSLLSPQQLAEYLDCRDGSGAPDAQAVLKLSAEGSLPPPDVRRWGETFWYRKTISDFIDKLNGDAEPDPLLISGKELAAMLSMSLRWVDSHRNRIIGAQKIGGRWRYNAEIIRRLVSSGKDILYAPVKIPKKIQAVKIRSLAAAHTI